MGLAQALAEAVMQEKENVSKEMGEDGGVKKR